MKRLLALVLIGVIMALLLGGCAEETPGQGGVLPAASGTLEIRVTDAPPGYEITAVLVTVDSVEVHKAVADQDREQDREQLHQPDASPVQDQDRDREKDQEGKGNSASPPGKGKGLDPGGTATPAATPFAEEEPVPEEESDAIIESPDASAGWMPIPIRAGSETFDLLKLQGVEQVLAVGELEPGTYTQIRMAVDAIEVRYTDQSGTHTTQAELPSGKLKFVRPFAIEAGKITTLTFDFIASKSVVFTGSGKVIFKPVIKLAVSEPKAPPLQIVTESLPSGTVGIGYEAALQATGGVPPYTWGVASGTLPMGLMLHPAEGMISGTPTASGTWTFTAAVSDDSVPARSATQAFVLPIAPPVAPGE